MQYTPISPDHHPLNENSTTRRRVLGGAVALLSGALLEACGGGGGGAPAPAPAPPPAPGPGGTPTSVPTLASLAADWVPAASLAAWPALNNGGGALRASANVAGLEMLSFAPYACAGALGVLLIDGQPVVADRSRWFPHQLMRSTTTSAWAIESTLRMPLDQRGVLGRISIRNTSGAARTVRISLRSDMGVRRHPDEAWARWDSPHGQSGNAVVANPTAGALTGTDAGAGQLPSAMALAFGPLPSQLETATGVATAHWDLNLLAGQEMVLQFAVAVAPDALSATQQASSWRAGFDASFDAAAAAFEVRWHEMFAPGNAPFSGHLLVLETQDAAVRSVYYHGALSAFALMRTSLPLAPVVFPTLGPQWATTISYFWDTEMFSWAYAMLEPQSLKATLRRWLALDLHAPDLYAFDNQSLRPAGMWYAANDWAVLRTLDAYLTITGDAAFLQEAVAGATVLERMVAIATAYRSLVAPGQVLADYGGNDNLLETAPNYIHRVASFNAGNVYLLRRAASYIEAAGQAARAAALRQEANGLRDAVLQLYVGGQGVWFAEHRNGTRVQVRHVFDYIVVGQSLDGDLSAQQRAEMTDFVQRELVSGDWMRAMSLQDASAGAAPRPDHGSTGAYDGWPALSAEVMARFGDHAQALDMLRRVEPVLREGPFAQSHEYVAGGKVRIAGPDQLQDYNAIAGASYVPTVFKALFGLEPGAQGQPITLRSPATPRGFSGTLRNVRWGGAQYTLSSDTAGVRATVQ